MAKPKPPQKPSVSKGPPGGASIPTVPPPHFPTGVVYLATPAPSPLLPADLKQIYCSQAPPSSLPNSPPRVAIKQITTPSHPAQGQSGLFNGPRTLAKGTWIRDYVGVVHLEREVDPTSDYDLCLERRRDGDVIGIDATYRGNEARFVNDYRGVRDKPNAVFELRKWPLPGGKGEGVRMAVWAGPKGVEKNEEICVSYGRGFWDGRKSKEEVIEVEEVVAVAEA